MTRARTLALLPLALALAACAPEGDGRADAGSSPPQARCGDDACDEGESCESDCGESSWPQEWVALEQEMLALVNEARASGATCPTGPRPATHPLAHDDALAEAARLHSLDMGEQGYFSHTSLDGRSPWQRIREAGYTASAIGENISAGHATAEGAFAGWMSSEGHCRNIMSTNPNEMGVGYVLVEGSPYGHYWTQTFGQR